jgi:hypothetical protein
MEVDILPITDDNNITIELADLIVGVAGELSPFEQLHGFSIDGVDLTTAAFPDGWRDRLVKVQNANTAAPGGHPQYIGWCLDKEDLCVTKLCAFREKDRNFVDALIHEQLVDPAVIASRLATVDSRYTNAITNASRWLEYRMGSNREDPQVQDLFAERAATRAEATNPAIIDENRDWEQTNADGID